MGWDYSVTLPRKQQAMFPDKCVSCGIEQPRGTMKVRSWATGWWLLCFWDHPGFLCLDVPTCPRCRIRQAKLHWLRRAGSIAFAVLSLALGFWILIEVFEGQIKGLWAAAIGFGCVLPWILWESLFPTPLDITVAKDAVIYHFNNGERAQEFLRLNEQAPGVT